MPLRRIDLGTRIYDIVGGCWWGKRKREPFLLGANVLDPTEPPKGPDGGGDVLRHVGGGIIFSEGLPHRTFLERWRGTPPGGEFRYRGINQRMTDEEVAAQLPDVQYRMGLDRVRDCVREQDWDEAQRLLFMLDERTPEYLHHLEREHWLTLYQHRPALRRLNMGFV